MLRLCSLAARGLWIELLAFAHKSGGYVRLNGKPPTLKELAVIVGSKPPEVERLLAELNRYQVCSVDDTDGAIMSRRMVRDAARREASKTNGRLGGRPKTETKTEPNPKPRPNLDHNLGETHIALTIASRSDPGSDDPESSVIATADADRFDRFWNAYPVKAKKGKAAGAFLAINPSEKTLAKMLAALEWQRQTPQWAEEGGKFIPFPDKWLEDRRWEDQPFQQDSGGSVSRKSNVPTSAQTRKLLDS